MELLEDLKQAVVQMKMDQGVKLTKRALDEGLSAERILTEALIPAMAVVGEEYEAGDRFIPEMLLSAKIMQEAMGILEPLLAKSDMEPKGKVVMGTVEGDMHDIGKNLVSMMLEGAGFETVDLGINVPATNFVEAVKENDVDLVGMSALLTTTIGKMPEVIRALEESGLRHKVKVMIGGAPVTQAYAQQIGADGFAQDAAAAARLAHRLMERR